MNSKNFSKLTTRREMLRLTGGIAGGVLAARFFPGALLARPLAYPQQTGAAAADPLEAARAQMGAAPIETLRLADNVIMLSGPGGNVVALDGPDGKIIVDCFVQPAWPRLQQALEAISSNRIRILINTHWHFDHTDNNGNVRSTGARIMAHENTKTRLEEEHDLLGMHLPPYPEEALPTQTFKTTQRMQVNGESLFMAHVPPAHTDTDIYVQYPRANVLHMGDTFFNGIYPFIDGTTGGKINGMIDAATQAIDIADANTQIVPGHGPLGNRFSLIQYRDVLVTIRDRVQKLKFEGRTMEEVVAAKPSAEFDATWGGGFMTPDAFVGNVYATL